MRALLVASALLIVSGCVRVSSYERGYLSEPTMRAVVDPLESRAATQLHKAREATSGGIWSPAGGGCGCTN